MNDRFAAAMNSLPLVAILRGVKPDEVVAIGRALVERGFEIIEVPLNSPDPLASIAALREALPPHVVVGAGTVTRPDEVASVKSAGGELIVMPHGDPLVIEAAKGADMIVTPGVATPTEALRRARRRCRRAEVFPSGDDHAGRGEGDDGRAPQGHRYDPRRRHNAGSHAPVRAGRSGGFRPRLCALQAGHECRGDGPARRSVRRCMAHVEHRRRHSELEHRA
jgi:hypothetical protein